MRILIIHNKYKIPGGEDRVVALESAALLRRGHDVRTFIVSNRDVGGLFSWVGVAIGMFWSRGGKKLIRREISDFDPDVVHVHNWFPLLSPSIFSEAKKLGIPVIWTLHNYRIACPSGILFVGGASTEVALRHGVWRTVFKRPYRNSLPASFMLGALISFHKLRRTWFKDVNRFIALTEFQREILVAAGVVPNEKVVVKGNFLPLAEKGLTVYEGSSRDYAVFIGRDSPEKGLDLLLEAWQGVCLPLKVVGAERSPDANAQNINIDFLGRISPSEIERILSGARFVIIPSRCYEGFPMVLLEAWRAGVPVVVPKHGAFASLVTHDVNGFFFNPSDAESLHVVVQDVQNDMERLRICSSGGRQVFAEKFTETANMLQLESIYRSSAS